MKTLTIALCLLLVLRVSAQQPVPPQPVFPAAPSFYVSYAVRDVPPAAMDLESSSAEEWTAEPGQRLNAPMPRPYPMRRSRYRRFQPGYGLRSQPQDGTAEAVVGAVLAAALLIALAAGDH